jgi:hypothetical protein
MHGATPPPILYIVIILKSTLENICICEKSCLTQLQQVIEQL